MEHLNLEFWLDMLDITLCDKNWLFIPSHIRSIFASISKVQKESQEVYFITHDPYAFNKIFNHYGELKLIRNRLVWIYSMSHNPDNPHSMNHPKQIDDKNVLLERGLILQINPQYTEKLSQVFETASQYSAPYNKNIEYTSAVPIHWFLDYGRQQATLRCFTHTYNNDQKKGDLLPDILRYDFINSSLGLSTEDRIQYMQIQRSFIQTLSSRNENIKNNNAVIALNENLLGYITQYKLGSVQNNTNFNIIDKFTTRLYPDEIIMRDKDLDNLWDIYRDYCVHPNEEKTNKYAQISKVIFI